MFTILNCNITIGSYTFDFVNNVSVESSWEEQTDKCKITLPAKLKLDNNKLREQIKKGENVIVKLAYGDNFEEVFNGTVTRIHPTVPIVIEAEDLMRKLKDIRVNATAKKEKMKAFLERVIPGYTFNCFDLTIHRLVATKITAAQLLQQIKSEYGFPTFVRNKVIVVGKPYDTENYKVHAFDLSGDRANVVQDSLEFIDKDDVKVKVTAISNLDTGKKIEISLGDSEGEERTLNYHNLSEKELKSIAEKEYKRFYYDGFHGELTIFGEPFVRHGDVVDLLDPEKSNKTGRYWVDSANLQFGTGGYRQTIKLGPEFSTQTEEKK